MAANRNSAPEAAMSDHTKMTSRSTNLTTWFCPTMPMPIPIPNATTRTPHPASPPLIVVATKMGPIARTAPTAAKAITMPPVMADDTESSRRNRKPSRMSRHTRERSKRPIDPLPDMRMEMRLTMNAEKPNVAASSNSASV